MNAHGSDRRFPGNRFAELGRLIFVVLLGNNLAKVENTLSLQGGA